LDDFSSNLTAILHLPGHDASNQYEMAIFNTAIYPTYILFAMKVESKLSECQIRFSFGGFQLLKDELVGYKPQVL
jgi:cysteine sulfinate desulfinase/cysteine desulfurase-like protein